MAEPVLYAGIYIERQRLIVSIASQDGRLHGTPEFVRQVVVGKTKNAAQKSLEQAVSIILAQAEGRSIARVGVAAYGPFRSIDRAKRADAANPFPMYGTTDASADAPFNQFPIYSCLQKLLAGKVEASNIIIQTDANTAALAEACLNQPARDWQAQVIVCLLVAERIGGGIVRGDKILAAPYHPEMGRMPVTPHWSDIKKAKIEKAEEASQLLTVSEVAGMLALRARLADTEEETVLDIEGFYLAQMCLNVTVILAPSRIVISGPLAIRFPGVLEPTRRWFEKMLRQSEQGPQIVYDALLEDGYISMADPPDSAYAGPLLLAALDQPVAIVPFPARKPNNG